MDTLRFNQGSAAPATAEGDSTTLKRAVFRSPSTPMILHARVVRGQGGGPEKTIFRSARYLDPSRASMAAVYIHPHDDPGMDLLREQARQQGCPLWEVGESGPVDPRTVRSLAQLCRKLRVSIWHSHDYKTDLLGLLLKRWWPMKLVSTVHGWTNETLRTRLYYHIDRWCIRRYDHVIAVSNALVDHCIDHGVDPQRITYIPNGIETREYQRQRTAVQARLQMGLPQNDWIIGYVGRLSQEKGVDRAIEALAAIRRSEPTAQLHLIGDGPMRSKLKEQAKQLRVNDSVRFWGWQDDPKRFYEAMDMLLLPSHTEGLPNSALEAMAMGVPVAATDVGGVRDLLDDGRCGVLLDPHAPPRSWADPILRRLGDAESCARLAAEAAGHVKRWYGFEHRMQRVQGVYDRVLGREPFGLGLPTRRAA